MRRHFPEYLAEALCLGLFMVSAGGFASVLESPQSPLSSVIINSFERRLLMGIAMGMTAVALIYSPLGKRSGAHMNPSVTLSYFLLGKMTKSDLMGYVAAQFLGGILGVYVAWCLLGSLFSEPPVNFVATEPGHWGQVVAFGAEMSISFFLFLVILSTSNSKMWAPYTGVIAGFLVALYITIEAPLSGMSMNPARSFASALPFGSWNTLWIYFVAPTLGMLIAAIAYERTHSASCAKLVHSPAYRCIFCGYLPTINQHV